MVYWRIACVILKRRKEAFRTKLAVLLRTKIAEEMKQFRKRMLKERPEMIYGSAYQIDTKLNLCEILMEMSQKMTGDELRMLLEVPNLLAFLYSEWIRRSGGTRNREELRRSVDFSPEIFSHASGKTDAYCVVGYIFVLSSGQWKGLQGNKKIPKYSTYGFLPVAVIPIQQEISATHYYFQNIVSLFLVSVKYFISKNFRKNSERKIQQKFKWRRL